MKIAVVGSREFKDSDLIEHVLHNKTKCASDYYTIVSGGARGVDTLAEKFADEYGITKKIFLPDWDRYGKKAGFLRNILIINEADKVIAFWDGKSAGTKNSIDLAIKQGKPLDIYVR